MTFKRRWAAAGVCGLAAAAVASGPVGAASTVSVRDNKFAPGSLSVARGATVRFVWRGRAMHNAVGSGAARFSSRVQKSGSYSAQLRKKGTVRVVCSLHSGMRMTIRVR